MVFFYECSECSARYPSDSIIYLCPDCSGTHVKGEFQKGVLKTILDIEYLHSLTKKEQIAAEDFSPYTLPDNSLYPVGDTPLLEPGKLREHTGIPGLYLKNDSANPSGSLKDRASQLVAAQALWMGEKKIVLASTGNAGSAMACAGAALGLDVVLFVPETAPKAKLIQSILYGARVIPIRGSYDDAFGLSIEFTERFGGINRNTAYNPITIEGKKSVSIEIFNQLGQSVPDTIYIPTGDGVILGGVCKGFADLMDAGLIEKLPKVVCVQAEGSNAIALAYETGLMSDIDRPVTAADSISVASPANGRMAVEWLERSKGRCVLVNDTEIAEAQFSLSGEAGVFVEPAAAAAYAGFEKDKDHIDPGEKVVVLLTGTGFKDLSALEKRVSIPPSAEPRIEDIEIYLKG
jgi:threonine synthase